MSEQAPETSEIEEGDWAKLKQAHAAEVAELKERLSALQPLAVEKAVREAGFAPDTPEGKALSRLAGDTPDSESVRNLAVELGFEAGTTEPKHEPTPNERAASEFAQRQSALNSVTTSDEPQNIDQQIDDLNASLRAARAARNWDEVKVIGDQLMQLNTAKMRASVATHV